MEEPEKPSFEYDFGIFGRVPEPQNQYYFSLETPRHSKILQETIPNCFPKYYFGEVQNVGNPTI